MPVQPPSDTTAASGAASGSDSVFASSLTPILGRCRRAAAASSAAAATSRPDPSNARRNRAPDRCRWRSYSFGDDAGWSRACRRCLPSVGDIVVPAPGRQRAVRAPQVLRRSSGHARRHTRDFRSVRRAPHEHSITVGDRDVQDTCDSVTWCAISAGSRCKSPLEPTLPRSDPVVVRHAIVFVAFRCMQQQHAECDDGGRHARVPRRSGLRIRRRHVLHAPTARGNCSFDASPNDLDGRGDERARLRERRVVRRVPRRHRPDGATSPCASSINAPGCKHGDLDLSPQAFQHDRAAVGAVASRSRGTRSSCDVDRPDRRTSFKDGSNAYWTAIQMPQHALSDREARGARTTAARGSDDRAASTTTTSSTRAGSAPARTRCA